MERLRAEYVKNNDELKKFDSAMGNNQRNVGNYQSALSGLGNALQSIPGPIGDIVRMFQTLQGVTSAVGTAFKGNETVIRGFTASTVDSTVATAAHTTAEVAQAGAVSASTAAIGFDTTATVANTAATSGNTTVTAANAGAQTAQAASATAATVATGSLTIAQRALNLVMKANPILLIIGLVASLATAFSSLQPVMDKIKLVTTALSSAFQFLRDSVYNFLTGEQQLQAGFSESIRLTVELEKATQRLRNERNLQTVESAKARQLIAQARLDAKDETLAIDERIKALKNAIAFEELDTAARIQLAEKNLMIERQKVDQYRSSAAELEALAQLEAEYIDLGTASLTRQRELREQLNSLEKRERDEQRARLAEATKDQEEAAKKYAAILAQRNAALKSYRDYQLSELDKLAQDIRKSDEQYISALPELPALEVDPSRDQAVLANAEQLGQELAAVEIANAVRTGDTLRALDLQQAEQIRQQRLIYLSMGYSDLEASQMAVTDMTLRHAQERADAELAIQETLSQQQIQNIQNLATTVTSIGTALFGKNKAMSVAMAIIDTYAAANSALKSTPGGPLAKGLAVAAVIAKGLANVRAIMSTNIGSKGAGGGGGGATGGNMIGMQVTPMGTLMPTDFRLQAPMAGEVGASMAPRQTEATPIYVDAAVDEKGIAIAVRRGESQIRSQQVVFT
jgi:hypothetical protein